MELVDPQAVAQPVESPPAEPSIPGSNLEGGD